MCDVTWQFGYLLHEPDIEILKEIMPPRQQNKMLYNGNMEHHEINDPPKSSLWCGIKETNILSAYGII